MLNLLLCCALERELVLELSECHLLIPWTWFEEGSLSRFCFSSFDKSEHQLVFRLSDILFILLAFLFMQTDKSPRQYRGMIHALATIYREEGFRSLYRGWLPSVIGVVSFWSMLSLKSPTFKNNANIFIIIVRLCFWNLESLRRIFSSLVVHFLSYRKRWPENSFDTDLVEATWKLRN